MHIRDTGRNNRLIGAHEHLPGIVVFRGDDNELRIDDGVQAKWIRALVANGSRIAIGERCWIGALSCYVAERGVLTMGAGCGLSRVRILMHEESAVHIGAACLFSDGIEITTSDMHSILDRDTGERINHAKDIHLADRVWIGKEVMVLKGASIGEGSVIGARAVVSGVIPSHVCAAGNPARVVRENVEWQYDLIPQAAPIETLADTGTGRPTDRDAERPTARTRSAGGSARKTA